MVLDKITLKHKDGDRDMVVIKGMPFYRSTGANSSMSSTWLPFTEASRSQISKPHDSPVSPKILAELSNSPQQRIQNVEFGRFGNTESMLISSALGGGYWDTKLGQFHKGLLETHYPAFYEDNKDGFSIAETATHIYDVQSPIDIEQLNRWLYSQASSEASHSLTSQGEIRSFFESKFSAISSYDKPSGVVAAIINSISTNESNPDLMAQLSNPEMDIHRCYNCKSLFALAVEHKNIDAVDRLVSRVENIEQFFPRQEPHNERKLMNMISSAQEITADFLKKLSLKGWLPPERLLIDLMNSKQEARCNQCLECLQFKSEDFAMEGDSLLVNAIINDMPGLALKILATGSANVMDDMNEILNNEPFDESLQTRLKERLQQSNFAPVQKVIKEMQNPTQLNPTRAAKDFLLTLRTDPVAGKGFGEEEEPSSPTPT